MSGATELHDSCGSHVHAVGCAVCLQGGRAHPVQEKSVVELVCDPAGSGCRWIIRPNQSLSWRGLLRVYAAVALCLLGISVAFALRGFWPVLPFAGLELLALGAAFYLCLSRSQWREIVSIDADTVTVEKGRRQAEEHWECPSVWAQVRLEKSPIAWYPSRLMITYQGRGVEIGRFLCNDERAALADALRRGIRERLEDAWRQR
jgi:uncharacterized membrane protein